MFQIAYDSFHAMDNSLTVTPPPALSALEVQKKIKMASDLFDFAFKVKFHQLKKKFPNATDEEIKKQTLELIERGCS